MLNPIAQFEPRAGYLFPEIGVSFFTQSTRPDLADSVFRFRDDLFNRQLGWNLNTTIDGREIDQFDGPDVNHCALLCDGGVVGCWRALPTTKPYLLNTVFPQLLDGRRAPADPGSWEITRFGVLGSHPLADEFATTLFASMFHFAAHVGAARLVAVTDVAFERVMRLRGIRTRRYGSPRGVRLASGAEMRLVAGEINIEAQVDPRVRAILLRADTMETLS